MRQIAKIQFGDGVLSLNISHLGFSPNGFSFIGDFFV